MCVIPTNKDGCGCSPRECGANYVYQLVQLQPCRYGTRKIHDKILFIYTHMITRKD
jgi:hypothetical protein